MYISLGMLAIIVLVVYILGVLTPILFSTHFLSKRGKSYSQDDRHSR